MENLYNLNNYLNRRQEKFQRTLQREASHTLRRDTLRRNKKEADIPEYDGKEDIGKLIHNWSYRRRTGFGGHVIVRSHVRVAVIDMTFR